LRSIDLTDLGAVDQLLESFQPDAILHLAAESKPTNCETNPDSNDINVKTTNHFADYCAEKNIPMVFSSTDFVFDGKKGAYTETDEINPLMIYGHQKAKGEEVVLDKVPKAIVLRTALIYGLPANGFGFLNSWIKRLQSGTDIYCFTDEYRSVISGTDAAAGVFMLLEKEVTGIYHLGGDQPLSLHEFVLQVATHLNLDKSLIHPSKQADVNLPIERPANVTLDSSKAKALGFSPRSVSENFEILKKVIV